MKVSVKHIYLSEDHNYFGRYGKGSLDHAIVERDEITLRAGKGIEGDRFFDFKPNYKGQITFFDAGVYAALQEEYPGLAFEPSVFRRNVVVSGVDLNSLIGKRFRLNGVEYTGSGECSPCFWMDEAVAEGTEEFLKGRGGLRCRILNDGSLRVGEFELEVLGDVGDGEQG
ncbi:MOSC domain-containing protein [Rubritalea tangerina]|uniref:MOSC domain-containing protein n=1 Tax=Rubritalea tangerina TaxID=430798 RepID=A0ABW4Z7Q5_9BACT